MHKKRLTTNLNSIKTSLVLYAEEALIDLAKIKIFDDRSTVLYFMYANT